MSQYFSFRGKIFFGRRDANGNPLNMTFAGNVPNMTLKLGVEKDEHIESQTGADLVDDVDITKRTGDVSITAEELIKEVVAIALNAKTTSVTTGSKTDIAVCTGPAAGSSYLLPDLNVADVVLSADATPIDAGKYTVDGPYGMVTFLESVTGPVTAAYSVGASTHYALHADTLPELWVRLNGINKKTMAKCVLDLYRVGMSPAETLEWINSKRSSLVLPGTVLADLSKDADGAMGQFGRYVEIE